ncbi:protein FAM162A-like [Hyperolius riggenbachi]|uniref:protein FAM162A-like n=1 Tax=Hyperolius riggenbachi TaxID=752182 RepID=UPI0035A2ACA4
MSRLSLVILRSLQRPASNPSAALYSRLYSQNTNDLQTKAAKQETDPDQFLYRNERRPTNFDKRVLLWAGRYKKEQDIPEYVSWETISGARSNVRVKVCMAMIIGTLVGCALMVRSGKKALREDDTLLHRNMERKKQWRKEAEEEKAEALKSH